MLGLRLRLRLPRLIGLLALRSQDQESNPSCNVGAEINLQDLRACNLSIYIYPGIVGLGRLFVLASHQGTLFGFQVL